VNHVPKNSGKFHSQITLSEELCDQLTYHLTTSRFSLQVDEATNVDKMHFNYAPCVLENHIKVSSLFSKYTDGKVKVKLFMCLTPRHEDVLGSGRIVPRILDLGTRWK